MKVFWKLCCSIIHRNPGFSLGMFIMSSLSAAIVFLGANFGVCASDTLFSFIRECNAPDTVLITQPGTTEVEDEILAIDGVGEVYSGFTSDVQVETDTGNVFSMCLFVIPDNSPFKSVVNAGAKIDDGAVKASVSNFFGEHNHINPGDSLRIDTPLGQREVRVGELVSNFMTLECKRDAMSIYEEYQYGYIFIKRSDSESLFGTSDMANQWFVYFDDDYDVSRQTEIMNRVEECFGAGVISSELVTSSEKFQSIYDDLGTISVLCAFIPGIIGLISLGFSFLFIRQIIENQRSNIGLLRALGYEKSRILRIFIAYSVLIFVLSMLVGIPSGNVLLSFCTKTFADSMGITELVFHVRVFVTVLMYLIVCAIGVLACVLSIGAISDIDPAKVYGNEEDYPEAPPKFVKGLKADAFLKISLVSMTRNFKKVLTGALCITACIVSMSIGFEGVSSIGYPIDAVFGGRFKYDYIVKNIDDDSLVESIYAMPEVKAAEPVAMFQAILTAGNTEHEVKVQTVDEDASLIYLSDAESKKLNPGNGIIIDEMFSNIHGIGPGDSVSLDGLKLEVTGIAREVLYTIMYISPETASELGYSEVKNLMVKLEEGYSVSSVEKKIADVDDNVYFVNFDSQKEKIRDGFVPMRTIMFIFALLAFFIGSFLVFNTSIINFNEKKSRYATLKALGTPMYRLLVISFSENLVRVLLGVIIAVPLSYLCTTVLLRLISNASQQYVMVNFAQHLVVSCGITILYVLLGVLISMIKIKRMDFVTYLNQAE